MLKLLIAAWLMLYGCSVGAQYLQEDGNNLLRILIVSDWGKGGNTGTYMSSYNITSDITIADESDLSETSVISASTNMSFLGKNNGGGSGSGGGGGGSSKQSLFQPEVAKAMGTFASRMSPAPSCILALGDNFYVNGVSSATDVLWSYLWKDVYLGYSGLKIPWYPVFGNHDYGGSVQAQLDRTKQNTDDGIWQFPASNYSKIFTVPGDEGATVGIVFIDTTTLAPSVNRCCNEQGGVSTDEQARRIKNQLYHINRMLNELTQQNVTWLLVAGHYPVFSAGANGDVSELQTYLLPLLKKYQVHAYLAGHDHISEHLQYQNMHFFIAGAGSMTDKLVYKTSANLTWGGAGYSAFGYLDATAKYLTFGIVDTDNVLQYQYTLTNPRHVPEVVVVEPTHDDHTSSNPHHDDSILQPILPVIDPPPVEDTGSKTNNIGKGLTPRSRQIIIVSGSLLSFSGLLIAVVYLCYSPKATSKTTVATALDKVMVAKASSRSGKEGYVTQPTTQDSDVEKGNVHYHHESNDYEEEDEETGSIDEDSLAGTINPLPVFNTRSSSNSNTRRGLHNVVTRSKRRYRKKRNRYQPGRHYHSRETYNELEEVDEDSLNTNSSIAGMDSDSMVFGSDFEPQPLTLVAGGLLFMPLPVDDKHLAAIQQAQQHTQHRLRQVKGLTKVVHVPGYYSEATESNHRRNYSTDI